MRSITEVLTPRATPALEYRRRWERRYHSRLVGTDAAIVFAVSAVGAVVVLLAGGDAASAAQAGVLGVVWFAMLAALRTRDAAIMGAGVAEYRGVVHASGLALGVFALVGSLVDWIDLRLLIIVVAPLGTGGVLLGRWLWRKWLRRQRLRGRFLSRTLVVGTEDDARYVLGALREGGENAIFVVGVSLFGADERGAALMGDASSSGARRVLTVGETDYPVFGEPETVAATAARIGADKIIIASLPANSPNYVKALSWQLEGTASELVLSHRVTDVVGPRISFRPIDGLPLLQIKIPRYEGGQHLLKRVLDIVVASAALGAIALIVPVVALCIKLDSSGPVLFWQERVGRDGERFRMLKFRTMHVDAEARRAELLAQNEGSGPLFKMREDPRVTRVGRTLRRLSLDELPQFWNVLTGDMSVVGPRPPLPDEVTSYDGTVYRRLYIKPGITGLWQVSGRSDLTWEQSVRLDLSYVENWSLMQDLQIMWRTARVMFHPKGAY